MRYLKHFAVALSFAIAIILLSVLVGGRAAKGATCTPIRPDSHTMVAGSEYYSQVYSEKCGNTLHILYMQSGTDSLKPYVIKDVEIWRYLNNASLTPVRSQRVSYSKSLRGHRVNLWWSIPAKISTNGYSGFIRFTIVQDGTSRLVILKM